jgi:hypothetical protein
MCVCEGKGVSAMLESGTVLEQVLACNPKYKPACLWPMHRRLAEEEGKDQYLLPPLYRALFR